MKAALVFTGSGPILILTTFDSIADAKLEEKLNARGIARFIAYEVPVDKVKARYGTRFSKVAGDLSLSEDMRMIDLDGHHVFESFFSEDLGTAVYSTSMKKRAREASEEEGAENEWLYVMIDEYGKLDQSSYIPMMGSRFEPPIPVEPSLVSKQVRFQISREGVIINGVPPILNGRKLILQGKGSPPLGRTDAVIPTCTWRHNAEGGWTCS
jgi:hypothetical protein